MFDESEILPGQTPLDPNEKADLIPGHLQLTTELNEFESSNILEAQKFFSKKRPAFVQLDVELIKKVHKRMFDHTWKWAGKFRVSDKNIGVDWPKIPEETKKLCDDFIYWNKERSYSEWEIAVRLHHRLVFIHPFPNGNGRHARLIADLYLNSTGKEPLTWGSASGMDSASIRAVYIAALKKADARDFSELLVIARK